MPVGFVIPPAATSWKLLAWSQGTHKHLSPHTLDFNVNDFLVSSVIDQLEHITQGSTAPSFPHAGFCLLHAPPPAPRLSTVDILDLILDSGCWRWAFSSFASALLNPFLMHILWMTWFCRTMLWSPDRWIFPLHPGFVLLKIIWLSISRDGLLCKMTI